MASKLKVSQMPLMTIGRVRGNSMLPRIAPDSFIIAIKWPRFIPKRIGQVYYIDHPAYGRIVKTLAAVDGATLWFRGESVTESVSTEAIGPLTDSELIGLVCFVIAKPRHKSTVTKPQVKK